MQDNNRSALVIFARDPVLGGVKTRLQEALPAEAVLELYTSFLDDTLALAARFESSERWVAVDAAPRSRYFENAAACYGLRWFIQEGADLGERMRRAFAARFAGRCGNVVIIGSDSPTLPFAYVERALASERDIVIGPSADAGYYLIGMRGGVADVFSGVEWGTGRVLEQTLANIARLDASLEVLPPWYDVDRLEDLRFLRTHLDLMSHGGECPAPATLKALRKLPEF